VFVFEVSIFNGLDKGVSKLVKYFGRVYSCDNGISMGAATIPGDLFASPGKEYFLVSPYTIFIISVVFFVN